DGTAVPDAPGGGGRALREQLGTLKRFLERFDFIAMRPDKSIVVGGVPEKGAVQALVNVGREYAIYLRGGGAAELVLRLSSGEYRVEWLHPRTGKRDGPTQLQIAAEPIRLKTPPYEHDLALSVRRIESK
ncbi:MAG: hypothetical protein ACREHD_29325, partial [Pirellulales bacterium]